MPLQPEFRPRHHNLESPRLPVELDLLMAHLGVGNKILEFPASEDDRTGSEVTGEINHFSRYAVAY